ncbi:MAG: AbrB/MazE/SpoVT family DNA-binding domain-containing protein [Candidatus Dormibacteria bacterium]
MSPVEVRVGPQGRVVIPAAIRRELGLESGEPLLVCVENGRVVLESRRADARRARGALRGLVGEADLGEMLGAERRAEVALEAVEADRDPAATVASRDSLRRP